MTFIKHQRLNSISADRDAHLISRQASVFFSVDQFLVFLTDTPVGFVNLNTPGKDDILLICMQDSEYLGIPVFRCSKGISAIL